MGKKTFFFAILIILLGAVGGLLFVTWDIPPPTTKVEKVIPDERLAR